MKAISVILSIASLILSGCSKPEIDHVYEEEAYVFGTLVKFSISGVSESNAKKAVKEVAEKFQHMHKDWNAWKAGELTRINTAVAEGRSIEVSPFVLPLLKQSKQFYHQSDGLFNPAIGALIATWGFHSDELPTGKIPSKDKIKSIVALAPSMDDVNINGSIISSNNKTVQFDFGGFGKGVALDQAEIILKRNHINSAIINAGGDLNTIGTPPGNRPWKVGIRHPVNWGVIASVELTDGENLYTSGNYERFREHEGVQYAHIIDPRTGMPVRHIVSTSIIDQNGALADAAATALTIAGPKNWYQIAKKMNIKYAMLIDSDGTIYLNPKMKNRVTFETNKTPRLVISNLL